MKKKIFLICITIFFLSVFVFSLIQIILWYKENKHTTELIETIDEMIIKEDDDTPKIDFNKLMSKNNESVGWITVKNTKIDYPFVQHKDNKYYLTHSFDKKSSSAGWVFMDYKNSKTLDDKNTVIYAHARKDKSMFGSLRNTLDKKWYKNKDNRIITITLKDEILYYQVFSSYHIKTEEYYIKTEFEKDEFKKFIDTITKRSVYNYKVDVTEEDYILTLSTCYNNTDKTVVHAKLIKRDSY